MHRQDPLFSKRVLWLPCFFSSSSTALDAAIALSFLSRLLCPFSTNFMPVVPLTTAPTTVGYFILSFSIFLLVRKMVISVYWTHLMRLGSTFDRDDFLLVLGVTLLTPLLLFFPLWHRHNLLRLPRGSVSPGAGRENYSRLAKGRERFVIVIRDRRVFLCHVVVLFV